MGMLLMFIGNNEQVAQRVSNGFPARKETGPSRPQHNLISCDVGWSMYWELFLFLPLYLLIISHCFFFSYVSFRIWLLPIGCLHLCLSWLCLLTSLVLFCFFLQLRHSHNFRGFFSTSHAHLVDSISMLPFSWEFSPVVLFFFFSFFSPWFASTSLTSLCSFWALICLNNLPSLTFFLMSIEIVCVWDKRDSSAYWNWP